MSGLVTAGVLLCGLPHAMAESVPQNNETYYSVNVPSEISLSSGQDETTFTVSGNTYQKRWLDIDITSKNNFNLKNGQVSIPYKLDKTKLEYEPQYVDKDSDSFSESIKVSKNEDDVKYSGNYQDQLQFTMNPVETRTIQLDCNGGTVNGKDTVAYTVKNGSSYGQLPVPVRSGYQFVAWKDDKGNTIYSGSQVEADTEKLTCTWQQVYYFAVSGTLDGTSTSYTRGYGTCNITLNGVLRQINTQSGYLNNLIPGDIIRIDNIKALSGFQFLGTVIDEEKDSNFTYERDSNNKITAITYTVAKSRNVYLNYKSLLPYNTLMKNNNLSILVVDSDKPSESIKSMGTLDIFDSKVDCYVKDNELHIYNINGGKVKAPVNSNHLFQGCIATRMDLKGLDVSSVENASYMFQNCTKLINLDVSNWDTSNIQTLEGTFTYCNKLQDISLQSWNTSSVKNLTSTFQSCQSITEIHIDDWDVSNVKSFSGIFGYCSNLKNINLKKWNTKNAETFWAMFDGCNSLLSLDLTNFNTSKVQNMGWMFSATYKLKEVKGLENLDVKMVNNVTYMFSQTGLEHIDLPDFTKSNITLMTGMFRSVIVQTIDLTRIQLNNVQDFTNTFYRCTKLKTIYVQDDYVPKSVIAQGTFEGCTSLVGGSGTKYDSTFIDSTGARIDGGSSNPGYFTAISQKPIETGSVVNIEGSDYIVMGQTEDGNYRLISGTSIGNIQYQPNQDSSGNYKLNISDEPDKKRYDGQNSNTYENSYIDRYLENTWYKNLPARMQKAIQETKIKQVFYTDSTTNPKWKFFDPEGGTNKYWYYNEGYEIAPSWVIYNKAKIPDNESGTYPYRYWSQKDAFDNEIYNSISRHVFLPCVEDINNIVDLNNANKIRNFLNSTDNHLNYMWLRDAYSNSPQTAIYLDYNTRSMDNYYVTSKAMAIRPSFVIDLSKVDYTVTGTVNYK